ncbi:MAG TPA: OmpH family outer membrane protein [Longimicrobiales bacterium]
MRNPLKWFIVAWATLAIAVPAMAQPVKIGFINLVRIEREAKRPQRDAERLKQEFAARDAEVRALHAKLTAMEQQVEKSGPGVSPEEINTQRREFARLVQQFEQARRSFVEDLERRKSEERQKFLRDLSAIVTKIAKAQKLDLVLQEAVHASRAIDITDQVMKALDQAESAAGR